jgi:N-methylhydantoinase A/oxoprolinase/acetone carboxylase beta subunit
MVKKKVAKNMASDLVFYLVDGISQPVIDQMLSGDNYTRFKVETPVILLGGPVVVYKEEMEKLIDANIVVPEHANVGNAVGALVGKGIKRVEILIKKDFAPITGEDVTDEELKNAKEVISYFVFTPEGRKLFPDYAQAFDYARNTGKEIIMDYMKAAGYGKDEVEIEVTRKELMVREGEEPVETKVIVVGIGTSKLVVEKDVIPDYMRKKAISSRSAEDSYSGK